jgi:hypothetical protein
LLARLAPGEWAEIEGSWTYDQAITIRRALLRRGLDAHVRGFGRRNGGDARVWARHDPLNDKF